MRDRAPTRRSTIADVAALAKVDRSVVSRHLTRDPGLRVRDETRKRIEEAIVMLDYRPNEAARSLRTARTRTLGLLIPDFANPIYGEIIKGAEAAAARVGSVLMTGSESGPATDFEQYLDLLGNGRVDGLLLASDLLGIDESALSRLRVPWLMINRTGTRHRYIVMPDEDAVALAVDHLLGLGHRRFAYISGPRSNGPAETRQRGYLEAVRAAGTRIATSTIVDGDFSPDGGARAMDRLLARPDRPTAVVVANVASAIGALHAASRAHVAVPADVSLVAIHDLPVAAHLGPPLTTVRMSLERLGARAVELLLEQPANAEIHEVLQDRIELIERESTAAPPAGR